MIDARGRTVVLVGASGDLGRRMSEALVRRNATLRAPLRPGTFARRQAELRATGTQPVEVDFDDASGLAAAFDGAECVVSTLSGLAPTIIDLQCRLLDAAVAAGVPRFIPSDFSLDFTKTTPGDNRNLDLRRTFMSRVDDAGIRATSILNGPFADILRGQAPLVGWEHRSIVYWGDANQHYDFTTRDDVADFTADAALDVEAPRILRIAGDVVSPADLSRLLTRLDVREWTLERKGGIELLSALIETAREASSPDAVFPPWQAMQYARDMCTGRGKLSPLDNARYGKTSWTSVEEVLAGRLRDAP